MKQVVKVAIFKDGNYLMGVRRDNGKWTEPGGHMENGENIHEAAVREVKEETGLTIAKKDLQFLGSKEVKPKDQNGSPIIVHTFKVEYTKKNAPTPEKDPDEEVFGWNWIPVENMKLPKSVEGNLHVPRQHNVLHFFLGFEKAAFRKIDPKLTAILKDTPYEAVQEYYDRSRDRKSRSGLQSPRRVPQ